MKFYSVKNTLALAAIAAALVTVASTPARAVLTQSITASIAAVGTLDVLKVADMDFGSWIINSPDGANGVVFVKDTNGDVIATPSGGGSATEIDAVAVPAQLTVGIVGGTAATTNVVVDMFYDNVTDFPGPSGLALSAITYRTATQNAENALTISTPAPVTIVSGAAVEPVFFGATITASAPVSGNNTATFDVTFAY